MSHPNYIQNKSLSNALPPWLNTLAFTHFVTLAFNQKGFYHPNHKLEFARDKLKHFHAKLDDCLLGSRWHKKPPEERTFFMAFPEKIVTNMHYHLLMRVNDQHERKFNQYAEDIWTSVVPSGTYDCKPLRYAPNSEGYASYITKEQFKNMNFNSFIISNEFLNI